MYMCPIPNGFRDRAILLYSSKLLIRKRYYVLFLIPVFIVQVTKLVELLGLFWTLSNVMYVEDKKVGFFVFHIQDDG
jgi:hypothetical protein